MRSSWFAAIRADARGLIVPGRPARHACDLLLGPSTITVSARGTSADLAWEAYESPHGWRLGEFALGRGGPIGVALHVEGEAVGVTDAVRRRTRTLRNRLARFLADGIVLPLNAAFVATRASRAELDTLDALCRLLAGDVTVRSRLAEPERVQRLAVDLAEPVAAVAERTGARRASVEIATAMHALKFRFPLGGRPLPNQQPLSDLPALVDRVIGYIERNPYAAGVEVKREDVERQLQRDYTQVDPWPFAALL
jgi:hypothetical protein